MKKLLLFFLTCWMMRSVVAQPGLKPFLEMPEFRLEKDDVEAHLRFLSSDALMGRRTGSTGNDIAAHYLAEHFKAFGMSTPPGQDDYFQKIAFVTSTPPSMAQLKIGKTTYEQSGDMLIIVSEASEIKKSNLVFAGLGWVDEKSGHDDYKGLDVKGKVVIVEPGTPDGKDPLAVFRAMKRKRQLAAERGALALFELYQISVPWQFFKSYFGKANMSLASPDEDEAKKVRQIPYGWLRTLPKGVIEKVKEGKKVKTSLQCSGSSRKTIYSNNVCGIIEGRDEKLKDEFVLLSAHYDHVGTGKDGGGAFTKEDSIFNGARDNGMGTVALLTAAKVLSKKRPLRSVIVLAVTGEEIGLLGSAYYAKSPLLPLEKTIFNLNTDGAGYNDTSYVSVVGYGRTGTDEQMDAGASPFGLKVFPNPAPEQNLFDRSDNASFARKG
ncbi:MAG: M28 family peptidase, partial [Bacteroidota bacterium]